MKFLLWFEPERAVVGTPLTIEHPDWFIGEVTTHFEGSTERPLVKFRMFDFGNPAARQYMIDSMSDLIDKQGIDIYRQDCNFALAPFWAQDDTPDRQGITQIRYAEGSAGVLGRAAAHAIHNSSLILFSAATWRRFRAPSTSAALTIRFRRTRIRSELRSAPKALLIGGRILERCFRFGRAILIISAAAWLRVWRFALFNVAGYPNQVGNFIPADFPFDWMRTMVAQLKLVRPYYYGDYYPLLPCSANSDCATDPSKERSAAFEWAAWQFNRPEQGDGMVQAFRRDESKEPTKNLPLRGLDPAATYEVTDLDAKTPNYDFRKTDAGLMSATRTTSWHDLTGEPAWSPADLVPCGLLKRNLKSSARNRLLRRLPGFVARDH